MKKSKVDLLEMIAQDIECLTGDEIRTYIEEMLTAEQDKSYREQTKSSMRRVEDRDDEDFNVDEALFDCWG
jgi:DNA-binding ferritin-like protein (Dps family)